MSKNILMVEDDPEQATLFKMVLAMVGYDVTTIDDAEMALEQVSEHAYDLVLVDWDLPGMKGDSFITLLQERHPGVKTVLFSNHNGVDQAARQSKADAWMVKGEGILRLQQLVTELLPAA